MKQKTEILAYDGTRIFFTFPDQYGGSISLIRGVLAAHGVFLDEDDDDSGRLGFITKNMANSSAGVKLGGSRYVYMDYVDTQKTTKDILAALQQVQAELPLRTEVILLPTNTWTPDLPQYDKIVADMKAHKGSFAEIAAANNVDSLTVEKINIYAGLYES